MHGHDKNSVFEGNQFSVINLKLNIKKFYQVKHLWGWSEQAGLYTQNRLHEEYMSMCFELSNSLHTLTHSIANEKLTA